MADSLIYRAHLTDEVPLTFLFLDYFYEIATGDESVDVLAATKAALGAAGLRNSDDDVFSVISRLEKKGNKAKEREDYDADRSAQMNSRPKGKKFWGDNLNEWALNRDPQEVCAYLADYDPVRTRQIYCSEDSELVFELAKNKFTRDFEFSRATFEAAVFGSGGGFKDDSRDEIDMVNGGEEAEAELAAFFGKGI